jgi:hypothetical protein
MRSGLTWPLACKSASPIPDGIHPAQRSTSTMVEADDIYKMSTAARKANLAESKVCQDKETRFGIPSICGCSFGKPHVPAFIQSTRHLCNCTTRTLLRVALQVRGITVKCSKGLLIIKGVLEMVSVRCFFHTFRPNPCGHERLLQGSIASGSGGTSGRHATNYPHNGLVYSGKTGTLPHV